MVESLLGWQRHFDHHFSYDRESGWDDPASAAWYAEEGVRLGDELKQALPDVDVILDLWPVTNKSQSQLPRTHDQSGVR